MENLKLKTITYKGFKIIPVTEKVKEKYSLYTTQALYVIVNPDDNYEWDCDNIQEAKDWIKCY